MQQTLFLKWFHKNYQCLGLQFKKKVLDILLGLKHLHPIVLYKFFIVFLFAVIVILRYLFKMDDLHYQFPNQDVVVPEPDEVFFVCSLHVLKHC